MSESDNQIALFEWAQIKINQGIYPELEWIYSVPNGGYRSPKTAAVMKKEGQKAGVPDIHLPINRPLWTGLIFEMKDGGNIPKQNQIDWLITLANNGRFVGVCNSFEHAQTLVKRYLDGFCSHEELDIYLKYLEGESHRIKAKRKMFDALNELTKHAPDGFRYDLRI